MIASAYTVMWTVLGDGPDTYVSERQNDLAAITLFGPMSHAMAEPFIHDRRQMVKQVMSRALTNMELPR